MSTETHPSLEIHLLKLCKFVLKFVIKFVQFVLKLSLNKTMLTKVHVLSVHNDECVWENILKLILFNDIACKNVSISQNGNQTVIIRRNSH